MSQLLCCRYNNYFNRIIKRETSFAAYEQYAVRDVIPNCNFYYNDGINTSHVVNHIEEVPDYIVVADDFDNITSRWFVMDGIKSRGGGQYELPLRRDLVADFYDDVVNAPTFVRKATIRTKSPLLMNKEDMIFNQIKRSETLLKDETESAWIVGFVPKDSFSTDTNVTAPVYNSDNVYAEYDDIEDFEYYEGAEWVVPDTDNVMLRLYYALHYTKTNRSRNVSMDYNYKANYREDIVYLSGLYAGTPTLPYYSSAVDPENPNPFMPWINVLDPLEPPRFGLISAMNLRINSLMADDTFTALDDVPIELNGKIIKDNSTGILYKINITETTGGAEFDPSLAILQNVNNNVQHHSGPDFTSEEVKVVVNTRTFSLTIAPFRQDLHFSVGPTRNKLIDAPYDMFCIPYTSGLMQYKNGVEYYISNKDIAIAVATGISAELGSANVYDIQIMPYCPLRDYIKEDGTFDFGGAPYDEIYDDDNNEVGAIFWATQSRFSLYIRESLALEDLSPHGLKISNETDMYRIADPSQSAFYDFSLAKNGGTVPFFEVDCDYKPYTPYIHIAPSFDWLYGQDFDDVRGLICGGDFSLPQLTSAWAEYQMNNKNFQLQFDREIQTLDLRQNVGRIRDVFGIAAGAIGGSIGAGISGASSGAGAGVKAGIGAATGLVGGIANYAMNEALRVDERGLKIDQFNYNLGNIQALPYGLTKVSAFNQNNKIWPFIEHYSASDVEVQALKDKIKYNGMTVMVIGKIIDYISSNELTFVQGDIIRMEDLPDDYHVANELFAEIRKGVYI